MQESAGRRFAIGLLFALLAGLVVAIGNPMDHVKADVRADAHGFKLSLELAAGAIEKACERRI